MSGALYFAEHRTAQQLFVAVVIRLYQTGSVETVVLAFFHSALNLELLQSNELATMMPAEDNSADGRPVMVDPTLEVLNTPVITSHSEVVFCSWR